MAAHVSLAKHDLAETLVQGEQFVVGDVQRSAVAIRRIADLQANARAGLTQRQCTQTRYRRLATSEIDLVTLDQNRASARGTDAIQNQTALEHHQTCAQYVQVSSSVQRDRIFEQNGASSGDVQVTVDRHCAIKGDIVRIVERAAHRCAIQRQVV